MKPIRHQCPKGHEKIPLKSGPRAGKLICRECHNASRRSKRTSNRRWLELNGERRILSEWARLRGVSAACIWGRLERGMSVEDAINGTGPKKKRSKTESGKVVDPGREWFIYSLSHPETREIRYIGWTVNPQKRYVGHLSYVRNRRDGNAHKAAWIQQIILLGMKPTMSILESGAGPGWADCEKKWIAKFRADGVRLLNLTDGGDGPTGITPSAETREKIRSKMKNRVFTPEWKAKISAAKKGQPDPNNWRRGRPLTAEHIAAMKAGRRRALGL